MLDEVEIYILYSLAPIGGLAVLLFVYNFFAAPYRIERDGRVLAQAKLSDLSARFDEVRNIPASGALKAARDAREAIARDTSSLFAKMQQWFPGTTLNEGDTSVSEALGRLKDNCYQSLISDAGVQAVKDFAHSCGVLVSGIVSHDREEFKQEKRQISEAYARIQRALSEPTELSQRQVQTGTEAGRPP